MRSNHDSLARRLGRVAAATLCAAALVPGAAGAASAAPAPALPTLPGAGSALPDPASVTPGVPLPTEICPQAIEREPMDQWHRPAGGTDGVLICHYTANLRDGGLQGFHVDAAHVQYGEPAAAVRGAVDAAPVADWTGMACPAVYEQPKLWVVHFLRGVQPVAQVAVEDRRYCGVNMLADPVALDGGATAGAIRDIVGDTGSPLPDLRPAAG